MAGQNDGRTSNSAGEESRRIQVSGLLSLMKSEVDLTSDYYRQPMELQPRQRRHKRRLLERRELLLVQSL